MNDQLMVETRGLTKVFGELVAVDRIDLSVRKGSIHGFVGPNGAGKTTAIKMLIGAIRSTDGEAFVMGHKAGSMDAKSMLGYAPERCNFYVNMAAVDYLVYMARVCGMEKKEASEKAIEMLNWFELGGFLRSKVGGFSAGMRQRLGLAQALIHEPQLLILDEPTANMDPTGRISTLDKLRQLCNERSITIFLSSHILSELEQVVDAVTLINKGQIIAQGSIDEVKRPFSENQFRLKTTANDAVFASLKTHDSLKKGWIRDDFIYLVSEDATALKYAIAEAVNQNGAIIEHLSEEQTTLQDIYRKTMVSETPEGGEEE